VSIALFHPEARPPFALAHLVLEGSLRADLARVGARVSPECPDSARCALLLAVLLQGTRHWLGMSKIDMMFDWDLVAHRVKSSFAETPQYQLLPCWVPAAARQSRDDSRH